MPDPSLLPAGAGEGRAGISPSSDSLELASLPDRILLFRHGSIVEDNRIAMLQDVTRTDGTRVTTTRSPLRLDGRRLSTDGAAPTVGQHTTAIRSEFTLPGRAEETG